MYLNNQQVTPISVNPFIYLPIYSLLIIICRSFISTYFYIVLSSYIRSFMVHSFHKAASTSACTTKTEVVEVEVHLCTTSLQLQSTTTIYFYKHNLHFTMLLVTIIIINIIHLQLFLSSHISHQYIA